MPFVLVSMFKLNHVISSIICYKNPVLDDLMSSLTHYESGDCGSIPCHQACPIEKDLTH